MARTEDKEDFDPQGRHGGQEYEEWVVSLLKESKKIRDADASLWFMRIAHNLRVRKLFLYVSLLIELYQPVGVVVKDNAIGAEGRGFDSRANEIRLSVANSSLYLRRFFGAVLPWR